MGKPKGIVQDLPTRIATAKHELSHALVAYALQMAEIEIKVFARSKTRPGCFLHQQGVCSYRGGLPHHKVFVGSAVFASPGYEVEEGDFFELAGMVGLFERLTGEKKAAYRAYVLQPLKTLLECDPILAIIDRLALPLAEGGRLKVAKAEGLEKFFPRGISMPLLQGACRDFREVADGFPFVK